MPPAMDSGPGDGSRHRNRGAIDVAQACVGTTQPGRVRIVPAQLGIRRSFSPVLYQIGHAPSGDTQRRAADDRSSRPTSSAGMRGLRKKMIVALARKLLIALWRLVREGVVPDGLVLRPAS